MPQVCVAYLDSGVEHNELEMTARCLIVNVKLVVNHAYVGLVRIC
jgi:hypothetical protein